MSGLSAASSLSEARQAFTAYLERERRPPNTINAYRNDLAVLIAGIGDRPVATIGPAEISIFLGSADSTATRKRRITSLRRFFAFLRAEGALDADPTASVAPSLVRLRDPAPITKSEEELLLAAAAADMPWSLCAVWLMMRLGLSRNDLLELRLADVVADPQGHLRVTIQPPLRGRRHRARTITAPDEFAPIYAEFLQRQRPVDQLFPVGFQAVNGMVDRVRRSAGIARRISPQTLRERAIVNLMQTGASDEELLAALGLADETQNRRSLQRFRRFLTTED